MKVLGSKKALKAVLNSSDSRKIYLNALVSIFVQAKAESFTSSTLHKYMNTKKPSVRKPPCLKGLASESSNLVGDFIWKLCRIPNSKELAPFN